MKLNKVFICLCLLISFFLTACSSPRGLNHKASRPIAVVYEEEQSQELQIFAKTIATSNNNLISLTNTPFGNSVNIKLEHFYTNALGQKCRKAKVLNNNKTEEFAVCLGTNNVWRYISSLN